MSDLIIREAKQDDWPQVHPFLSTNDKPPDTLDAALKRYCYRLESEQHIIFVAEQSKEIIGLAMAYEQETLLMSGRKQVRFSTLCVTKEHRRKGAGKALFSAICNWAEGINATWLEWYASHDAIPFYEKLGYEARLSASSDHPFFELEF